MQNISEGSDFVNDVVAGFLNGGGPAVKVEPTAEIRAGARQVRSLFVAYTDEGFTADQAMELIGFTMGAAARG